MQKVYSNYNKKIGWKICISRPLFQFLEDNKSSFPSNLNWDSLLLLVSKIEYKLSKRNKKFVEIPSDELKYYVKDYTKYFNYLIGIGAVEKKNYSTTKKRCNAYCIKYECFEFDSNDIYEIEISLKPKYYSVGVNNCTHLTKWLNKNLKIDCYNYFYSEYSIVKPQKNQKEYEKSILRTLNYRISTLDLSNQYFRASRNISSDNRLHTNLTNFPSKLRQFITYDGWDLIAYDIKNSQPYFLIIFLERFNEPRIRNILKRIYSSNIGTMSDKITKLLYSKEFQEEFKNLKDLILDGNLYEYLMEILTFKRSKNGYFKIPIYNKLTEENSFDFIESKREACKKMFMKILYSPNIRKQNQYKQFELKFPHFCEMLHLLKSSSNQKDSYKKFPKLLQHIESDCILDFITKNIAKEYPNMPMFIIHDSIATIRGL